MNCFLHALEGGVRSPPLPIKTSAVIHKHVDGGRVGFFF